MSGFAGNQLCGLPLTTNCSLGGAPPDLDDGEENDDNGIELDVWFISARHSDSWLDYGM